MEFAGTTDLLAGRDFSTDVSGSHMYVSRFGAPSVTATSRSIRQADYCAANAFLAAAQAADRDAAVRSVNWTGRSQVGMTARTDAPLANPLMRNSQAGTDVVNATLINFRSTESADGKRWAAIELKPEFRWALGEHHRIGRIPVMPGTGQIEMIGRRSRCSTTPGRRGTASNYAMSRSWSGWRFPTARACRSRSSSRRARAAWSSPRAAGPRKAAGCTRAAPKPGWSPRPLPNSESVPRARIHPGGFAAAFLRLLNADLGLQSVVSAVAIEDVIAEARECGFRLEELNVEAVPATDLAATPAATGSEQGSRTEAENAVAEIRGEFPGIDADTIGPGEDFFEPGGNLLVAVQLIAMLRKRFSTRLPMRLFFADRRISGLARTIVRAQGSAAAVSNAS